MCRCNLPVTKLREACGLGSDPSDRRISIVISRSLRGPGGTLTLSTGRFVHDGSYRGRCGRLPAVGTAFDAETPTPHNVILLVPDGLRARIVSERTAPAMAALRDEGVDFRNPHSLFPTFTTPNASAMATGHYLGDTGDFRHCLRGFSRPRRQLRQRRSWKRPGTGRRRCEFRRKFRPLDEKTLLQAARDAGYSTATIGKLGPALIFDDLDRSGDPTIVVDDSTGSAIGIPLNAAVAAQLQAAGLPLAASRAPATRRCCPARSWTSSSSAQ